MSPDPCKNTPSAPTEWLAGATWQQVALAEIDPTDRTFVCRTEADLTALTQSVRQHGLLNPLRLRRRPDGRLQVVCGWRRLLCLQRLNWTTAPALVLPTATPDLWCLQAVLEDNQGCAGFNLMETALLVNRLGGQLSQDRLCREFLPRLGLPGTVTHLQALESLLHLEPAYQELVAQGRLTLTTAARLATWDPADRLALLPLWRQLTLSRSYQRELLEFLTTLSRRHERPPRQWLELPEVRQLLADPARSGNDKRQRLWELLRRWCFPRLQAVEEQLKQYLANLGLKDRPDLRLEPPPAFEGEEFRLELRCRNPQELARLLAELTRLLNHPDLQAIFNL